MFTIGLISVATQLGDRELSQMQRVVCTLQRSVQEI